MMGRRLRVRVVGSHGKARVILKRWGQYDHEGVTIGEVNLTADDADENLADLRMRAADVARQLNGLERG